MCANLANRGVKDVLIVCCDGLTGFPEAIEATWPLATVQTCVVHLIRNSLRFVNYKDRTEVVRAIKPIYTAPDVEAARREWETFRDSELGAKYPVRHWFSTGPGTGSSRSWRSHPSYARSSTPRTRSSR